MLLPLLAVIYVAIYTLVLYRDYVSVIGAPVRDVLEASIRLSNPIFSVLNRLSLISLAYVGYSREYFKDLSLGEGLYGRIALLFLLPFIVYLGSYASVYIAISRRYRSGVYEAISENIKEFLSEELKKDLDAILARYAGVIVRGRDVYLDSSSRMIALLILSASREKLENFALIQEHAYRGISDFVRYRLMNIRLEAETRRKLSMRITRLSYLIASYAAYLVYYLDEINGRLRSGPYKLFSYLYPVSLIIDIKSLAFDIKRIYETVGK